MSLSPTPKVSIILPTCDRAEMTRRCLDALSAQTHPNLEVIVVDDGSRDDTPAMLKDFAAEHEKFPLLVLTNPSNRGANFSRNRGVAASSGELVAFLDSDCLAEPNWIEELVNVMHDPQVGAVTGLVLDPPPKSIYDLTFRGTHRIAKEGPARRLIAGNLCVRREPLLQCMWSEDGELPPVKDDGQPDVSFSGACDEESLTIGLKAQGFKLMACPKAVVLHEHYYDRKAFFRQAYHGGRAAADFVRRHKLPHRLDMKPFMLTYASLPLALATSVLWSWWSMLMPAVFFLSALAAILYNDLFLKGKTPFETIRSFPMLLVYYHVRLWGYVGGVLRSRSPAVKA